MTAMTPDKVEAALGVDLTALRMTAVISPSGCWEGKIKHNGYVYRSVNGRPRRAHRVAWEAANGPIPEGLYVCHRCNNKRCFNPEHLYLGTPGDNVRDAWKDGLMAKCLESGMAHGPAKANAEKTHCAHGHDLSGVNLYITSRGTRHCKACCRRNNRDHRLRTSTGTKERVHGLTLKQRIERDSIPVPEAGCWLWTKSSPGGYGQIMLSGRVNVRTHRATYETYIGPIPAGKMVRHKCGTRTCCNPDHLFLSEPLANLSALEQGVGK